MLVIFFTDSTPGVESTLFYPRDIFSFRVFRYPVGTLDARSSAQYDKNEKSIDGFNLFPKYACQILTIFQKL